jgi:predicted lipid-binding transport protein (Tim44 family)
MLANKWTKGVLILFALLFLSAWALQVDAWARAGRSSSFGSRGSRSASPPRTYTPRPTQPSRPSPGMGSTYRPTTPPTSQPSSFWRSFGGGMLGGIAGGMLFRSLFGGPSAYGGGMSGRGGGGIGLFDILLLAGIGYLIYRFIKKRREAAMATSGYSLSSGAGPAYDSQYPPVYDQLQGPPPDQELEKGLADIQQFDPSFNEAEFQDQGMDLFFKIQGAWANRDLSSVRHLLTPEAFQYLQDGIDQLKSQKRINRLENIAVRSVDITEAWQESGADYITARVYANLLDYDVDEASGRVVEGSKTDPVKFEEYWTFTRPVGRNPWQLSAIQQAPA